MDPATRAARHDRPRRAHAAAPAAADPRPPDQSCARLDTAPPGPLALARRLHHRAQRDQSALRRRLTAAPAPTMTNPPSGDPAAIPAARTPPNTLLRKRPRAATTGDPTRSPADHPRSAPQTTDHIIRRARSVDPG